MGQVSSIRICAEQDKVGKSLHSEFSYETLPLPDLPKSFGDAVSLKFLWSPKFQDHAYKIPLTDENIASHLPGSEASGVCKAPQGSGYYFSDASLKYLREKIGYQREGAVYGGFNSFFGLPSQFQSNFPHFWHGIAKTPFVKGLRLSGIYSLLLATPAEVVENYYAVKAGDRSVGEAVADGVTDVGIGLFAGAVGIAAGAKLGTALGTAINPGLGTALGLFAGAMIGYGVGYFLDEAKEQVLA